MPKQPGSGSTTPAKQDSSVRLDGLPFGPTLTAMRTARNLTQTNLATSIHRSTGFISLLETSQRRPNRELVDALADALGLEPDSDERGMLIRAAGFEPRELSGAITRLVEVLAEQLPIGEWNKLIVRADLAAIIDGWLDHFKTQKQFEQGHFSEVVTHGADLLQRKHYSPTLLTSIRLTLAEAMVQQGELSAAEAVIADVTASTEHAQVVPEWAPPLQAEARALQGLIVTHTGAYSTGKKLLGQSAAQYHQLLTTKHIAEDIGFLGLGISYKRLAQVAILQGEPDNGFNLCQTAEAYLRRASESEERSHWLRRTDEQKAWAYTKMGEFQLAIELREQTHAELVKARDHYGITRNLLYTGDDYLSQIKLVVNRALSDAFPDGRSLSDLNRRNQIMRGVLATSEARIWLSRAEQCYSSALETLESYGQHMLVGRCLTNLAKVLRYKFVRDNNAHAATTAQQYLTRALTMEDGIGHRRRLPGIYEALADLELDRGKLSSALGKYKRGLEEIDSYGVNSEDAAANTQKERLLGAIAAIEERMREQGEPVVEATLESTRPKERWLMLCRQLVELTQRFVLPKQENGGLVARSNRTDVWIDTLYTFDAEEGGRILLQNALSDSLTDRLRAGLSPAGAHVHASRHHIFSSAIEQARRLDERSWDLCCRPHVERSLQFEDTSELVLHQLENAYRYMVDHQRGYQLDSCIYEVPLGFAVKRSHILIEAPSDLAPSFLAPDDPPQAIGATLCYEFHDEAFAKALTDLFREFIDTSERILEKTPRQEKTQDWLKRLLEPPTVSPGLTGNNIITGWSRAAI